MQKSGDPTFAVHIVGPQGGSDDGEKVSEVCQFHVFSPLQAHVELVQDVLHQSHGVVVVLDVAELENEP